jgi:hypothetical protein
VTTIERRLQALEVARTARSGSRIVTGDYGRVVFIGARDEEPNAWVCTKVLESVQPDGTLPPWFGLSQREIDHVAAVLDTQQNAIAIDRSHQSWAANRPTGD